MPQDSFRLIRRILPYTWIAVGIAVLYSGYVFYSRWDSNRRLQQQADQREIEQAQKTYEMYGAGQLKVLLFYATPSTVRHGQETQLCYSVSNATKVSIDNGVEPVKPSLNRCVAVKPRKTTTYTITIEDDNGHRADKSVDVIVK